VNHVAAGKKKDPANKSAADKKSVVKEQTITIPDANCKFGHMSEDKTRAIVKALSFRVLMGP